MTAKVNSVWWLRDAIEILRANGSHDHVKHLSALLAEHTDMLEALQYCQQSLLYMTHRSLSQQAVGVLIRHKESDAMSLNSNQIAAANALRAARPEVYPGTNVVRDEKQRQRFYEAVTSTMTAQGVKDIDINRFCTLAGIPD